jgi:hypothetical protein
MPYGKLKAGILTWDNSGTDTDIALSTVVTTSGGAFTGTVTVPTAAANDNSTKAASTAYVQTELGDYSLKASPVFTGDVTINAQGDIRLADSDSTHYVGFQSPATVTTNVVWTLPAADASSSGDALVSDGSGNLSWTTISASPSGSNTQVQFNNSGSFGGSGSLTFDDSTDVLTATNVHDSKGNVRDIPLNSQSSAYEITAADQGKCIYTSADVTLPSASNMTGFNGTGGTVTIINKGTSNISIIPKSGQGMEFYIPADTTLYTSTRTLAPKGLITVLYVTNQLAYLSGGGIS